MSALLFLRDDVRELNIFAEAGYTTRNFSKFPRVPQSVDFKSALTLAYFTNRPLPNRRTPRYRNHFCLYRNHDSLILVRSETTLIYADHDASLQYDVIKPKLCHRTSCVNDKWAVSYDQIDYSQRKPDFITYSLVCSGEWWYYDKGVCLNGVTAYQPETLSAYLFIYLELHPRPKSAALLTTPRLVGNPSSSSSSSSSPSSFNGLAPTSDSTASTTSGGGVASVSGCMVDSNSNNNNNRAPLSTPIINNRNATTPNLIVSGCNCGGSNGAITNGVNCGSRNAMMRINVCGNLNGDTRTNRCSNCNVAFAATTASAAAAAATTAPPTVGPEMTCAANASVRPIVTTNESNEVPNSMYKQIVPSLYWFETRCRELESGSIDYFLPTDYKCASSLAVQLNGYRGGHGLMTTGVVGGGGTSVYPPMPDLRVGRAWLN